MTCTEAREALLSGEITPEVGAHQDTCQGCRAERELVTATEDRLFSEIDTFIEDNRAFEIAWSHAHPSTPSKKRFFTILVAFQTARASENSNNPLPPLFDEVRPGTTVDVGYWEARIAKRHPKLLEKLKPDDQSNIRSLMGKLTDEDMEPRR